MTHFYISDQELGVLLKSIWALSRCPERSGEDRKYEGFSDPRFFQAAAFLKAYFPQCLSSSICCCRHTEACWRPSILHKRSQGFKTRRHWPSFGFWHSLKLPSLGRSFYTELIVLCFVHRKTATRNGCTHFIEGLHGSQGEECQTAA